MKHSSKREILPKAPYGHIIRSKKEAHAVATEVARRRGSTNVALFMQIGPLGTAKKPKQFYWIDWNPDLDVSTIKSNLHTYRMMDVATWVD